MSSNPYVRELRIFNPAAELSVDDQEGGRARSRVKKNAQNPMAGLLDQDEMDGGFKEPQKTSAPAQPARQERGQSRTSPAAPESENVGVPTNSGQEAPAGEELPIMGDAPDIIEGDFADPIDI